MVFTVLFGASTGVPTNARLMLPNVVLYTVLVVGMFALGIGSIRARRWARALTLVLAWMWLVLGVTTMVMMSVWMPRMLRLAGEQEQIAPWDVSMLYCPEFLFCSIEAHT